MGFYIALLINQNNKLSWFFISQQEKKNLLPYLWEEILNCIITPLISDETFFKNVNYIITPLISDKSICSSDFCFHACTKLYGLCC